MYRISCFLIMLAALGFGFAACEQNPNSNDSGNLMDQPMAAKSTTPANPKIVYAYDNTPTVIGVMDTTGEHQTTIYTASSNTYVWSASWSPGSSIAWVESSTSRSIRAADISVNSSGVPVGSNFRTVTSCSTSNHYLDLAVWSSTSTVNKIAFVLNSRNTSMRNYVCRISASGSSMDTLYSAPYDVRIEGISWNADDSRLALCLRNRDSSSSTFRFVIINTSTGAVTDSIPVSIDVHSLGQGNCFEWSRSGLNKLAFVSNSKIYYLTPTTGSTPTTNSVGGTGFDDLRQASVTWSPSNSHLLYVLETYGSGANHTNATRYLNKNTAQTTTIKTLDKSFVSAEMNWHH